VDELQTGLVSQTEINALDGITSNIQTQIDNLQTALGGINITISGNTLSGVVLLPYLEMYYYTQTDVKGKVEESYNKIIENQTTNYYNKTESNANYYNKTDINTKTSTISGQIDSLSGQIDSISGKLKTANDNITTISSNINTANNNITTISSNINTANNNITTISGKIDSISGLINNTISSNLYNNTLNIVSISSLVYNTISSNINNNTLNIVSINGLINNTISSNIYSISNKLAPLTISVSGDITTSGNLICDKFLDIPKSYFKDIDYSNTLQYFISDAKNTANNAQGTANTAKNTADDCHYEIYEEGSSVELFGVVISFTPPSDLNKRINAAKKAGTDAQDTANSAKSSADYANTTLAVIATVLGFNSVATLLTAVGSGVAYTSLGAIVAGHTTNLGLLNTKTQFMNSDIFDVPNTTSFCSDIKLYDVVDLNFLSNIYLCSTLTGSSFFKGMVHFYNNVSIDGTITNLELNNNTTNINTISGKIKYITSNSGNTLVNSSIYVQSFSNPTQYVCKLANAFNQLSYIRSDLTISGNVEIKGGITNTEVNDATSNITTISGKVQYITSNFDIGSNASNTVITSSQLVVDGKIKNPELNTNTTNITTISGLVNTHTTNITTISGLVNTNTTNITTISGLVNTNTTNITTISGLVNTNTANITTISGLVNTNTTNITTISGLVNTNKTNIEKLSNVINVQGDAASGYTINIGFATSKVYINGDLYYNNDLFLRNANSDGNQVGMNEYINQFF
jgi:hypothetical protein